MKPSTRCHAALMPLLCLCIAVAGITAAQVYGQEIVSTWTDSSGKWDTSGNWSPAVVPDNNAANNLFFSVAIYPLGSTPPALAVSLNISPAIDKLTLGPTVTLKNPDGTAETLILGSSYAPGELTNFGSIDLANGSTLDIYGAPLPMVTANLYNDGAINLGSSRTAATLKLNGAGDFFDLFSASGRGVLTLSDNSKNKITGLTGSETFINDAGETLQGAGTISNLAFVNNGTLIADGSNPLIVFPNSSGFANNGDILVNPGSTLKASALTNNGNVLVNPGGNMEVSAPIDNTGSIIVGGAGPGTLLSQGLVNTGILIVDTGSTLLMNGSLNNALDTSVLEVNDGGTLQVAGNLRNAGSVTTADLIPSVTAPNSITVNGSFQNIGTFGLENPGDSTVAGSFVNGNEGVILLAPGTTFVVAGPSTSNANSWQNLSSSGTVAGGTYDIQGVFAYNSAQRITAISTGTTLDIEGSGQILNASSGNALQTLASNRGTFGVFGGGFLITGQGLNNSGTLEVESTDVQGLPSVLAVGGDLTNSGSVSVTLGGDLIVSGSTHNAGGLV